MNIHVPKFRLSREIHIDKKVVRDTAFGEVPEEIMAFAEQVLGNAQARIALTDNTFSLKEYGNGPAVSVTISVACNQDDTTMAYVARTLGQYARFFAKEQFEIADKEYQQMLAERQASGGPPSFKP